MKLMVSHGGTMAEGTFEGLDRGLAVAEFVVSHGHVSLAEVMEHLGLAKATAYRALITLEARGWVSRDSAEGGYRPGAVLLRMLGAPQSDLVRTVAEAPLQKLVDEVGETANLGLLVGNALIYEKVIESTQSLRMRAEEGTVAELHMTALGRAFLSQVDPAEVDERLGAGPYPKKTDRTLTDRADVITAVEQARSSGYAMETGETEEGAGCIAVALRDGNGKVIGAVSVAGPIDRLEVQKMSAALKQACEEISAALRNA